MPHIRQPDSEGAHLSLLSVRGSPEALHSCGQPRQSLLPKPDHDGSCCCQQCPLLRWLGRIGACCCARAGLPLLRMPGL